MYSYAKGENPVGQALLNNIRGRYGKRIDENKPKVRIILPLDTVKYKNTEIRSRTKLQFSFPYIFAT